MQPLVKAFSMKQTNHNQVKASTSLCPCDLDIDLACSKAVVEKQEDLGCSVLRNDSMKNGC